MAASERVPRAADDIRATVQREYGRISTAEGTSCCGGSDVDARKLAEHMGYTADQLDAVPDGANLGLGCGNPTAIANLRPGDTVIDLGSGAGFDALLAAPVVGKTGRVIGVDMTPEMLAKARKNAARAGVGDTVEFREGTIEALPVEDSVADVIISNCVINLSPDKAQVFREAFRVLKPGGRLAISDILLSAPLPEAVVDEVSAYVGCIAGAMVADEYLALLAAAGFTDIRWTRQGGGCDEAAGSYNIEATKP